MAAEIEDVTAAGAVNDGFPHKPDREKGYKKTASLLLLLEKSRAAHVLSRLPEEEVEGIVKEILALKTIDRAQAKKIAAEFGLPEAVAQGVEAAGRAEAGRGAAEELLVTAFGEKRARELLEGAAPPEGRRYFSFLDDLSSDRLAELLGDESPRVIAMALSGRDGETVSRVLQSLSDETRTEVTNRMERGGEVLPEAVRRVADALRKKLFQKSDLSSVAIDGESTLREILSHMETGRKRVLLDRLSEEKPDLASQLEKELFSMEIFLKIEKRDLRAFLRPLDDRKVALSLRGEREELKDLFLEVVSEKRKASIEAGLAESGEEPASTVQEAKRAVVNALKARIAEGKLRLLDDHDYLIE